MSQMDDHIAALLDWAQCFPIKKCDSSVFYDDMTLQASGYLPVIDIPFDPTKASDWNNAGLVQDFYWSACTPHAKVLDFGPGDGWPSLLLAPQVAWVTGVDASSKRIKTCIQNAARLGVSNVDFVHYVAGQHLPFDDGAFDAVVPADPE